MRQQIQGYLVGGLIVILSLVNAFLTGDVIKVIAGVVAFLGVLSLLITYTSEYRYKENRLLAEAAYGNTPHETMEHAVLPWGTTGTGPPSSGLPPYEDDIG